MYKETGLLQTIDEILFRPMRMDKTALKGGRFWLCMDVR